MNGTFLEAVEQNPYNRVLLERLPTLGLRQCYLTAGCLFQSIWNQKSGLPVSVNIKDYDLFYFDDDDLSWEAEDAVIRHVSAQLSDLDVVIDIKNQARVHLWYGNRFGSDYPKLSSTVDGISRYLISCTCVGIDVNTRQLFAPNGLEELWNGILRMNPLNPIPALFMSKAHEYRIRGPWLSIVGP
jgi:hypothetical protein